MMWRWGCVFVACALVGCAHTRQIALDDVALDRVNRDVRDRTVQVVLRDGQVFQVRGIRVRPDSTAWQDGPSGGARAVATEQVRRIALKRWQRGVVDGAIWGFAVGAPAGVLIIDSPDGRSGFRFADRAQAALAGGLSGALWGAGIGALAGGRITYIFVASEGMAPGP